MKTVAVNFANDRGWYRDGQPRLINSLRQHGFDGDYLAFQDFSQLPGCPSHVQVPYAFKLYAIREAVRRGYDVVFYGDASIYAVGSVQPVFEHILKYGYYLEATEHNLGTWSSDACLSRLGIEREEAFTIPTIVAGCVGFDFRQGAARYILETWLRFADDGVSFVGSWTNNHGEVSSDPRVKGHRHDQSVLSGIAYHAILKVLPFQTFIYYPTPPPPQAVFHCHPTI
jgi:hypothetical protein